MAFRNRQPSDPFDLINNRIKGLEERVAALRNERAPTVPFYDGVNWPANSVEGQVVIAPTASVEGADLLEALMVGYIDTEAVWEDLYVIDTSVVSIPTRLTTVDQTTGGIEWFWAIWNNAHDLIYAVVRDHTGVSNLRQFWKINPDGSGATLIYSTEETGFSYLYDDSANRPWGIGLTISGELEVVNLLTGAVDSTISASVVTGYTNFSGWSLSRDGERLFVFLAGAGYPNIGCIMNRDGTGVATLLTAGEYATTSVTWCPGNTKLIYPATLTVLKEMNDDGTGKTTIYTAASSIPHQPIFSPDETMVAVNEGADMKIFAAGTYTELFSIPHEMPSNFDWDWSPDSTKIILVSTGSDTTIDVMTIATGSITRIYNDTDPLAYLNIPRWGTPRIV